jgi:deoxyribodipyrimidine photo-lyase
MTSIFWHRRDLRIEDNAGLYKALSKSTSVTPIFIFDTTILDKLPKNDQRVIFIHQEIGRLKKEYRNLGSDLRVEYGIPTELIPAIAKEISATAVYTNRDYEPYAKKRDLVLFETLKNSGIAFIGTKDHVIFEKDEVLKNDGGPYTVFTPYSRKWKDSLNDYFLKSYPTERYSASLTKQKQNDCISLDAMGFSSEKHVEFPARVFPTQIIKEYTEKRDFPAISSTSKLGLHLRFGTISIRALARVAVKSNETFLNELIWREFYQMIIHHFPHSASDAFRPIYDRIPWEHNEAHYNAWCEGKTGYPLVDAGMRELNATGFMHNRVRMVVASFLSKHLLLDWRLGEAYFAEKLLDYDLASNVGGWQWAAGCGCDAAPYFRVFNPHSQQEKFDKEFIYTRKWVPEFGTPAYPQPIVEHSFARLRAIERYKTALNEQ